MSSVRSLAHPVDVSAVAAGGASRRLSGLISRAGESLLQDPRAALGAGHTWLQRALEVAVDAAHLAVVQVHADTAAAGAHAARRVARLVSGAGMRVSLGIVQGVGALSAELFRTSGATLVLSESVLGVGSVTAYTTGPFV